MKLRPAWFALFIIYFILSVATAPSALASNERGDREVRIVSVQGDVRLSPGDGKHADLKKPWEQVLGGERMQQGFALASGQGRAEIEFENGATVFLAENSLLLFQELSALGDRLVSRVTLATGTATFCVQLANNEKFFIDTPTEKLQLSAPEAFFARLDAYLDATGLTPQGEKGEAMIRSGRPTFQLGKGQTRFLRGGEIIEFPEQEKISPPTAQAIYSACLTSVAAKSAELQAAGISSSSLCQMIQRNVSMTPTAQNGVNSASAGKSPSHEAASYPGLASDWDGWVSQRVQQKSAIMTAALKASGLSSPVAGLANMYQHGNFFQCEPYGTCWEPTQAVPKQQQASQSKPSGAPPQAAPTQGTAAPNAGFQPQTVQWEQFWSTGCDSGQAHLISRIAHTPQELQELLRLKRLAERTRMRGPYFSSECYQGNWIRHSDRYARVVTRPVPDKCLEKKCKPEHPRHPVWVLASGKVGFVPAHPQDVKGKPPINLKNGILVPPSKAGEPAERLAWKPSEKIRVLSEAPKEYQSDVASAALAAPPPEIQAHLMLEAMREGLQAGYALHSQISFNYKTQRFMMAGDSNKAAKSGAVAVGGIASNGKVQSFADGRHSSYAQSFAHSSVAASYVASSRGSGSYSSGFNYSAGGRSSGGSSSSGSNSGGGRGSGSSSSSSGSSSSGSHSSGSTGGSSASTGSSSSVSSSTSSSAGGGRPH
ncbi:MAG TPA: hypothetical protein VGF20_06240 [Candidatus Acidoferrum sp.]|jgi:hypothetical protein